MAARVIAKSRGCVEGKCPTMIETTSGEIAVQGYVIADPNAELPEGHTIPAGEAVVRIPTDVFKGLVEDWLADQAVHA